MKDRVPLYPGRVTLTPVSGQANTYDMVRADQPTEQGTPLNKENLLSDETAAALGLSGDPTVDDAFGALAGSIKLSEVEATLPSSASWRSVTYGNGKLVAVASGSTNETAYSTNGINWTAATLPSSASWQSVTYGDGKFVAVASTNNKAAYSLDGINWSDSAQLLVDSAGDDITDDVAQALGVSKIVTGSYTGTGTYGSSNPNSLTFDFDVKLLILQAAYGYAVLPIIFTQGEKEYYTYYMSGSISNAKMTVSFDGHTISWYTSSTNGSRYGNSAENMQFNHDGEIYYYAAIG